MKTVQVIQTAKDTGDHLAEKDTLTLVEDAVTPSQTIKVDISQQFQTLEGFGGAFTESAAVTLYKLPREKQLELLKAYFDPLVGHGYTFCRTHINSCDFSLGNYAYDDVADDFALEHFTIERDQQALIPMIRDAFQIAGAPFKLLASPWSPPAWMKTNGQMNHGGRLKPECRQAWAQYYCRYIREYERENIPIWGLTVQNETEANQTWDSCLYTAEEERDFVRDYLGPVLHQNGLDQIRLLVWDHNRDRMFERASVVFEDPQASQYVWGTAFHWYMGNHFENVQKLHDAFPQKQLLFTEGCQEGGPHIGEWGLGERYARSVINDLNRWTVGWIDWNLLLDDRGGPNHAGNYCSAPILVRTQSAEILYQSSYYYLGHFSRYIRPGAVRVKCETNTDALDVTAFLNGDRQLAIVVLNRTSQAIPYALQFNGLSASADSPAHSIITYLIKIDS